MCVCLYVRHLRCQYIHTPQSEAFFILPSLAPAVIFLIN